MGDWYPYAKAAATLFVILNPIGVAPLFLSFMVGHSDAERRRTARTAGITVACVLLVAAFAGAELLRLFGVSIGAFRVAGGFLLLGTAVSMVQARLGPLKHTPEESAEAQEKESVAVVPLGIPLLAGPGSISSAILYAQQARGATDLAVLAAIFLAMGGIVTLLLSAALRLQRALGKTGINVLTRLMGILLTALSIEFIVGGLQELIPALGR
ncbi:MAG: NAAT family transporter [Candidatus Methylomirabilis sp.]|nr:NAAT family transporter [Deltaproteobacteria bacterium]